VIAGALPACAGPDRLFRRERGDRGVAAGSADQTEEQGSGRGAAMGVPLPDRRPKLGASTARRVYLGAGRRGGVAARARALASTTASRGVAGPRWIGGRVPRAARRRAGDDREAALAARKGGCRLWRSTGRRTSLGGDRRLADRALSRLPLRRDPGAATGARAGRGLGNDRLEPGEARGRQPLYRGAGSSARSSPGQNSMRSPRISLPATGRW
jgi:hypothetical protein